MYKNIGFFISGFLITSTYCFLQKLNIIEEKFDNYFENGKKSFYSNDVRLLMSICIKDLIEKDKKDLAEKIYTSWNNNTTEDFMLD